jgi:formamidase
MEQYLTPMGPTKLHVNPIFEIGPLEPRFSEWLVFEGLSVDENGKQHYLDASIAYKRAVLNCIDYLSKFGYTKEQVRCQTISKLQPSSIPHLLGFAETSVRLSQVYLLLSCCPCEGRISGIVDVPNACATLAIPVSIFDQVLCLKIF